MSIRKIELGGFYHIYNRGVEKRTVFCDNEDNIMFLHHLYALNNKKSLTNLPRERSLKLSEREPLVTIHAFCLMKNHYHILVEEIEEGGISKFMQKIGTGYTMYFNKKYERTGALFQGKYKFKKIETDAHFNYILDYIHLNPHDEGPTFIIDKLLKYRWSSLPAYLNGKVKGNFSSIVMTEYFLNYFGGVDLYKKRIKESFSLKRKNLRENPEILIDGLD